MVKMQQRIQNKLQKKHFLRVIHLGSNLPSIQDKFKKIINKLDIIDLVILSKLEKSKSEIRRLIKGNAVKINDQNYI